MTPLFEAETTILPPFLAGKSVYDLGSGSCWLSAWMRPYAKRVVAIDKERMPFVPGIEQVQAAFHAWAMPEGPLDVIVLSWPVNHLVSGLSDILQMAVTIVYRGCNDGLTACGTPGLFRYLSTRTVMAYAEGERNSCLTVYGAPCAREPTSEEQRVFLTASEWPLGR
jgi:hypothetical protein